MKVPLGAYRCKLKKLPTELWPIAERKALIAQDERNEWVALTLALLILVVAATH